MHIDWRNAILTSHHRSSTDEERDTAYFNLYSTYKRALLSCPIILSERCYPEILKVNVNIKFTILTFKQTPRVAFLFLEMGWLILRAKNNGSVRPFPLFPPRVKNEVGKTCDRICKAPPPPPPSRKPTHVRHSLRGRERSAAFRV